MKNRLKQDLKTFISLYQDEELASQFYAPHFALGFITAVASAPETIAESEWLPMLVKADESDENIEAGDTIEINFSSRQQQDDFYSGLMAWLSHCRETFDAAESLSFPDELCADKDSGVSSELKDFANGYLNGFEWLYELWDEFASAPEIDPDTGEEEEISTLSNMLGMGSTLLIQCAIYPETLSDAPDEVTELFSEFLNEGKLVLFLNEVLSDIGMQGYQLASDGPDTYVNENKNVGRNDPCPCGSGKKYKKCCLH